MSSGDRVSIPNTVRKTILNIKEITDNHSEDEIYAMLKDCSMDPNETARRLLLQDPFHEVRRKRDRKKENLNKESTVPRRKPGMQGRGNRGGWGNYSSRNVSNDAGVGRNILSAKENGANQGAEDGSIPCTTQDKKIKETSIVASSSSVVTGGPPEIVAENTSTVPVAHLSAGSGTEQSEVTAATVSNKLEDPMLQVHPIEASKSPTVAMRAGSTCGQLMSSSSNVSTLKRSSPSPASDPNLMPSRDSWIPVGTSRREVGSQPTHAEQFQEIPVEIKSTASGPEVGSSFMQGKMPGESQGVRKNLLPESSQQVPSTHVSSSIGRPSSNYSNRSQQAIGPQKVGPSKEWKPKPPNCILAQGPGTVDSNELPAIPVEAHTSSKPASGVLDSMDATSEPERKLEESHILDGRHVVIPNYLHVPEAEKLGFCFGSFDASFGFHANSLSGHVSDKSLLSEASDGTDESTEELSSRNQYALATTDDGDGDYPDRPPSSCNVPENPSAQSDISSSVPLEYRGLKQETSLPTAGHQNPVVHTSPNFSFGFMPPMPGSQLAPFESSKSQVQQPFDPASYYAQFYHSVANSDGHISPFHLPGVPTKHNGHVAVLSARASQSSEEVENSLTLSAAGPTPIATQAAGVMLSSIAVTQQPLPVFRRPTGVHLSYYPPNYIPYGPYISPFYVPPPAIHHFLSNGTLFQKPQAGNICPAPPVATTKYPLPQYNPGSNTSAHIAMPGSYGPYGLSLAGCNPSSAAKEGNTNSNKDLGVSQFKESDVYITGQQSEGSGVWIAGPGQDILGLQASAFYNLPQGGQVAYTQTQACPGPFASICHPSQPVTTGSVHPLLLHSHTMAGGVDMVGPTASVYQQPHPTQINWPNNY